VFGLVSSVYYTVTALSSNSVMGTVSGGSVYEENSIATLTATANIGYRFVEWNDGNTNNPRQLTVTCDTVFIATFEISSANQFTVTVLSSNSSMGSVSGGGVYTANSIATLVATPFSGYRFVQWNDGNTDNPRTVTVTYDISFTATFGANSANYYTVTAISNNNTMGSVSGGGLHEENSTATLTATANTNYAFENWTSNGVVLSTVNPFAFTVTSDIIIVANFKSTIGISETTTQSGIVLYPNPVEDILHIQSSTTIEQATIYDLSGRIVHQVQLTNDIPVQDLARGVYVIKIETQKGIEVRKIVKQ
jgi:hypothetical protein